MNSTCKKCVEILGLVEKSACKFDDRDLLRKWYSRMYDDLPGCDWQWRGKCRTSLRRQKRRPLALWYFTLTIFIDNAVF